LGFHLIEGIKGDVICKGTGVTDYVHQGATSVVKWMGHESSAFEVTQEVRQCGFLSADLYKMYVNPLLDRLNHTGIGAKIGNIICNTVGSSISIPYNNIGSTYVLKSCKEVSGSSPLCPCNPEAIRL
jgi:hypothetical protein